MNPVGFEYQCLGFHVNTYGMLSHHTDSIGPRLSELDREGWEVLSSQWGEKEACLLVLLRRALDG